MGEQSVDVNGDGVGTSVDGNVGIAFQGVGKAFGDVYAWPMPLAVNAGGDLLVGGTFAATTLDLGTGLGAMSGGSSFFLADIGP